MINNSYSIWFKEFTDMQDPRLFWDLIKYRLPFRQVTISYSKGKARERRVKLSEMEETLKHHQTMCDQNPSTDNINRLVILKTEYDLRYERQQEIYPEDLYKRSISENIS